MCVQSRFDCSGFAYELRERNIKRSTIELSRHEAGRRTRTFDLCFHKASVYAPAVRVRKSKRQDLNLQRPAWKAGTLPIELLLRVEDTSRLVVLTPAIP